MIEATGLTFRPPVALRNAESGVLWKLSLAYDTKPYGLKMSRSHFKRTTNISRGKWKYCLEDAWMQCLQILPAGFR